MKIKMRQSLRLFYGDEVADNLKGSKNWLHRFSKRNFISLCRRTNKKKIGNTEKLPITQSFHRKLRKDVQSRRRRNDLIQLDDKLGRWVSNSVWISQQGSCSFLYVRFLYTGTYCTCHPCLPFFVQESLQCSV